MTDPGLPRLLVGVAAVLVTASATAQPQALPELVWQAPPGCPQTQRMREKIQAFAGSGKLRESRLRVEGEITKLEEGRFQLQLVLRDGELVGKRKISSDSCEDLAGAAAVAVGLLLTSDAPLTEDQLRGGAPTEGGAAPTEGGTDTTDGGSAARPASTGPVTTAKPPRSESTPRADAAPEASLSPRRVRAIVRAPFIGADIGMLPGWGVGASLGAGLGYEHWRFLVMGGLWLPQTVFGSDLQSHGADVGRMHAALVVGRGFRSRSGEWGPCVTLALERIKARGLGPGVEPRSETALWLSAGPGVFWSLHLGESVAIAAELGVRVQTSRPWIAIDGLGDVRQLGPVALNASLGAEWFFW